MVLTRLPLTVTGKRWPLGPCARTASSIPQLQKRIPEAPAPLIKSRRVAMPVRSLNIRAGVRPDDRRGATPRIHYRGASPFSFSMPTASTNSVQRAMSFAMNFCTSAGP